MKDVDAIRLADTDFLLSRRAFHVAEIEKVDAELHRRGLRSTQSVIGRPRPVTESIFAALEAGPMSAKDIAKRTGQSAHTAHQMLSILVAKGALRRVRRGMYALPGEARGG